MKAAVWKGIDQLDIDDLPIPEPEDPYDVQIRVVACGVCATDVHILEGKFPMFKPPRVIGHEFTGVVSAIGKGVTKLEVGDRVAVETGLACDRRAAFAIANELPERDVAASHAKAAASEAAAMAAKAALQVHCAIGYTWEVDLHLWMKRAWSLDHSWGSAATHRARIANRILGDAPAPSFGFSAD